jgi:hypothetical protein
MNKNTRRFSINQDGKDITILLYRLGSLCIRQMETLLYGTAYKHGHLFYHGTSDEQEYQEEKAHLLTAMMDLAQEIGATKDDVLIAWEAAMLERKKGEQLAADRAQYWKHVKEVED